MKATKKSADEESVQVSVLITCLGIEGAKIYDSFTFTDPADKLKIIPVLEKFDEHFKPQKSETFERFKFMSRRQGSDEPFDKFLLELKAMVNSCNFGNQQDSLLRDQIVLCITDNATREQLLCQSALTLQKAVEICRTRESAKKLALQMQVAGPDHPIEVDAVRSRKSGPRFNKQAASQSNNSPLCRYCGGQHPKGKCPAFGKKCLNCGYMNHISKVCERATRQGNQEKPSQHKPNQRQITEKKSCDTVQVEEDEDEVKQQEFLVSSIGASDSKDSWLVQLYVDGFPVKFKIDTGAQCNVLPKKIFDQAVKKKKLRPGPRVTAYNGEPVKYWASNMSPSCTRDKSIKFVAL